VSVAKRSVPKNSRAAAKLPFQVYNLFQRERSEAERTKASAKKTRAAAAKFPLPILAIFSSVSVAYQRTQGLLLNSLFQVYNLFQRERSEAERTKASAKKTQGLLLNSLFQFLQSFPA